MNTECEIIAYVQLNGNGYVRMCSDMSLIISLMSLSQCVLYWRIFAEI